VGESRNALAPAVLNVRSALRRGRNELVVRVTCGGELVPDAAPQKPDPKDVYSNRHWREGIRWLRKPQFTYGWDWVDALPNVGIWRGVRLEGRSGVVLHDVRLDTELAGGAVFARVTAECGNLHPVSERRRRLEIRIRPPRGRTLVRRMDVDVPSGLSETSCRIKIPDAKLWWPNGMGEQPLYRVTVRVLDGQTENDRREFETGLRTVEIDRARIRSGGRRFCVRVNGRDVFCRGGNWIPADAIPARAGRRKIERLIGEARTAHFTMLRIWGGGIYEAPAFYQACDRAGILVWHDFMFACNVYPDMDEAFLQAVRAEAEAAVRRLRHHPCIALWSGNNENHQGFTWTVNSEKAFDDYSLALGGIRTYNYLLPEICRRLDPARPYWPGSPYGGEEPNAEDAGDCHWWSPFTMNRDIRRRIRHEVFDECRARFVSEYGVIGPCHVDSVKQYLKPGEITVRSRAWKVHTNYFEKETTPAAIRYHYAEPEALDIRDYILYGQMFQALMYGLTIEALRFRKHDPRDDCQGAVIWMFDDCWGEVGWTPIDYYLRRKPSYYWIRRACAPVKCIVRRRGRRLVVRAVNDTLQAVRGSLTMGWMRLDGGDARLKTRTLRIPANGMVEAGGEAIPAARDLDPGDWLYAATLLPEAGEGSQSVWTLLPHRRLRMVGAPLHVVQRGRRIELISPVYRHGVHVDDRGRAVLSDNYFDLLPNVPKVVSRLDGKTTRLRFRPVTPA
jgi:beta-mannosidase